MERKIGNRIFNLVKFADGQYGWAVVHHGLASMPALVSGKLEFYDKRCYAEVNAHCKAQSKAQCISVLDNYEAIVNSCEYEVV